MNNYFEIILGLGLLTLGIYRMIVHLRSIENERFDLVMQRSSDYGVGLISAFLIGLVTHSTQVPLLIAVVLYASRKINLRQATFLLLGVMLVKISMVGIMSFLPFVKPKFIANVMIVAALIPLLSRKRGFYNSCMAFLWLGISFRMFPVIRHGLKIVRDMSIFDNLMLPQPAGDLFSYLNGFALSSLFMSESSAVGVSIALFSSKLISIKQATQMMMGGGVGTYFILILLTLLVNRRASLALLSYAGISLLALLIGAVMLDYNIGALTSLFDILEIERFNEPLILTIVGHQMISVLIAVALLFLFLIGQGFWSGKRRQLEMNRDSLMTDQEVDSSEKEVEVSRK